jgi:hypothetical protein
MELTQEQRENLETLRDQLTLPKWSTKVRITIMNQLLTLGLVELKKDKRNIEFWHITELGNEALS